MSKDCQSTRPVNQWQFWIDRGGTFTDIVARRPDGEVITHKLLSDNPQQYADAAIQGIRDLINISADQSIPCDMIQSVKMGTTVATNALLERQGENVVLLTTRGFGDALRIGYQTRPDLFALDIKLPEMLYQEVIEVNERIDARGEVLIPLDLQATGEQLQSFFAAGYRACAIVFMHGYRFPKHEKAVASLAREMGFSQVSVSSVVSPLMKLVLRGDTTVVDAYLSPILRRYVNRVAAELEDIDLMFMQSSGGLVDAHYFQGKDAILSGPAGGVVGMVKTAERAGFEQLIGFDMGGTSTDVSHYNGEYERAYETRVAGVRLRAPMMLIHTVAAGGGSILHFDGSRYRVGPDSAGADPGPACYRKGGPLTITDCNVMLGKLDADFFPPVFGPNADQPLDRGLVEIKFEQMADEVNRCTGSQRSAADVAEGFLAIAIENMANAIKKISVQRGYDVSSYTLCCFGGAGGQHACLVADAIGITRVLVHPHAGVLSAYGIGLANVSVFKEKAIEITLDDALIPLLRADADELENQGENELTNQGIAKHRMVFHDKLLCRYAGSDTVLIVDLDEAKTIVAQFEKVHQQRFGFISPEKEVVVESIQVESMGSGIQDSTTPYKANRQEAQPGAVRNSRMGGENLATPFFQRQQVGRNQQIRGPAVIVEKTGTTVIEPGWQASLNRLGDLILERYQPLPQTFAVGTGVDPVMLEIFNNLFMSIAEQMGVVLQNTAESVNIKERLDFSCAIFDSFGDLVANAPHMPVHLGSMSDSIKTVIRQHQKRMQAGDTYILNAPYNGGTHLPDVTIIKPVFGDPDDVLFYVASRGHHADIGGKTPGSMPPDSTRVDEEGILFDNLKIIDRGKFLEPMIRELLSSGPWPARNIDTNIADFKAQIAACEKGSQELLHMVDQYGQAVVQAYMQHVQDNAEESVRGVLDVLPDGKFSYAMDDGYQVAVQIKVNKRERRACIDFSGTSGQHPGNFNAPSSVATAAVLYVFRCLVGSDIPLNAGCLKPLSLVIPDDSMIAPKYPAAVVAGNVETSQVVVDTLFGAIGNLAASQGTMNNFTWGNDQYQYYETLCGGSGASARQDGVDAVHTHMTNSRLTDPEVLEWRFPVLLESFHIRKESGGAGHHRGGNGTVRRLRFLQAMTANILANRRRIPPYGVAGGEPGQAGRNYVERVDGRVDELAATGQTQVYPGDVFVIETPGGGGYGSEDKD